MPEKIVKQYLEKNAIPFNSQVSIGRFIVDYTIPPNLVIEVQGTYWHADKRRYNRKQLGKRQQEAVSKDKRKILYLTEKGYYVFLVWELDIKSDIKKAMSTIINKFYELNNPQLLLF